MLPGKGRPEPPAELDQAEARAWRDVIDAVPSQWLDTGAQLILRRVVTQVAFAERLEERLRRLGEMADDPEALAAEKELASSHRDTLKAIAGGLRHLRATPSSRAPSRESRSRFERGAVSMRPWDIVARKGKPDGPAS